MFEAFLTIVGVSLAMVIYGISRKHTVVPEEADSIEVLRAPAEAAKTALDLLCDGGVPAWIEQNDDHMLSIHVEEQDLPMVQEVLKELGLSNA